MTKPIQEVRFLDFATCVAEFYMTLVERGVPVGDALQLTTRWMEAQLDNPLASVTSVLVRESLPNVIGG